MRILTSFTKLYLVNGPLYTHGYSLYTNTSPLALGSLTRLRGTCGERDSGGGRQPPGPARVVDVLE